LRAIPHLQKPFHLLKKALLDHLIDPLINSAVEVLSIHFQTDLEGDIRALPKPVLISKKRDGETGGVEDLESPDDPKKVPAMKFRSGFRIDFLQTLVEGSPSLFFTLLPQSLSHPGINLRTAEESLGECFDIEPCPSNNPDRFPIAV
jgi:hypothetical protein